MINLGWRNGVSFILGYMSKLGKGGKELYLKNMVNYILIFE